MAAVLAGLVFATSCGGGGSSGDDTAASEDEVLETDDTLPSLEDEGEPVPGGIYRVIEPEDADPGALDPLATAASTTQISVAPVYQRLLVGADDPGQPYFPRELEGELAESWEASEDGLSWTFKLREGVRFQDIPPVNGREFTSADVACTLEAIKDRGVAQQAYIGVVDSWETPDDHTVVMNLSEPNPEFAYDMAGQYFWILPCEGTNGEFNLAEQPIGTGPFMLEDWTPGSERFYAKNPNYWEEGLPYVDGVEVIIASEPETSAAALRTGQVDFTVEVEDQGVVDQLLSTVDGLEVSYHESFPGLLVYMNATVEPFDDLRVRQAVAYAIDRQGMLDTLRNGRGQITGQVVPVVPGSISEEEAVELQPYDPDRARDLLAEAGYPEGFDVKMVVSNGYGETVVREAQWVQEDLKEVGINVELDIQDHTTYLADTYTSEGNFTMGMGFASSRRTFDGYVTDLYSCDGNRNYWKVCDEELDAMVAELRSTLDPDERETMIHDIQVHLADKVADPFVTYIRAIPNLKMDYVNGYLPSHTTLEIFGSNRLKYIWLEEDAPGRR